MTSCSQHCALSIDLLPEFGWSINSTPIYGPGSAFQGSIKLKLGSLTVSRVRLAFTAFEKIPPFELSPGVIRSTKQTIFSIQSILWESKERHLDRDKEHAFPFTLQMPMVQFPPSIDHFIYQCKYQLIAIVDTPESLAKSTLPLRVEIPLTYMPFIETSLMKSPLMTTAHNAHLKASLKMNTLSYVPNDAISAKLNIAAPISKKSTQSLPYVTVHLKLQQTICVNKAFSEISDQVETVASVSHKIPLVHDDNHWLSTDVDVELKIPAEATPSCDYSALASITYKLMVSVEQKGPMGGIWKYVVHLESVPITIGTLGYGITNSSELKAYTTNAPTPKFMKAIEYEDALPLYDPMKLPTYESSSPIVMGC